MYRPNSFYLASVVWGIMIGAVLACSAGSQGGSTGGGDGGVTEPPAEAVTSEPSGGAAEVDPLESIDPCTVVTQEDATAFFGAPSDAGMAGSKGNPTFCLYATADQTGHLSVNMRYVASGALGYEDYTAFSVGSTPVAGLGDGAFYMQNGATLLLYAARGPWLVHVSGNPAGQEPNVDALKPVAETALSRLP
jgi:hypothetical protein